MILRKIGKGKGKSVFKWKQFAVTKFSTVNISNLCGKELLDLNFNIKAVTHKISVVQEIAANLTYSQKSKFLK